MGKLWDDADLSRALADAAHTITGGAADLDPLVELVKDARIVAIGESTHGTHEFYRLRAELSKRLIAEHGFNAVAAEADWPDAYRVNRFVRGQGQDQTPYDALEDFERFPTWMWRNYEVVDFVAWLREHNAALPPVRRVGFYGLDLYSLSRSVEAVIAYLAQIDPEAAEVARRRYACLEQFGRDPQAYGYATTLAGKPGCEREVVAQLTALREQRRALVYRGGIAAEDAHFEAEQNARVVMNAEEYYRSLFEGRVSSWNLRDTHMADALDALLEQLARTTGAAKVLVWAHNSHVGDARATELGEGGQVTLGQLARERHPGEVFLIAQSTYGGSVTAATRWGGPAERMHLAPGLGRSWETLLHDTALPAYVLRFGDLGEAAALLREPRLERAIGVVYLPDQERESHYYDARLADHYDALIFVDDSMAVRPLDRDTAPRIEQEPETYPTGI